MRRFYKDATLARTGDDWGLLLDGRPARTPGGAFLRLPGEARANALLAEWRAQGETIEPATMPATRVVNSALDGLRNEEARAQTRADIVKYAGSDLLCYRAGEPESLAAEQADRWDPVLEWARARFGARFLLAAGVGFVAQPPRALEGVTAVLSEWRDPVALAALHVMTTLTGSALLALATAEAEIDAAGAWRAAHVDEDHQMRQWGEDAGALARRAARWREMRAAALLARAEES